MRFALKICICTVLIVALLFGVLGQILIAQSFRTALRFRVQAAVADYSALASAMEAELYGIRLYYNTVSPGMFEEILKRAGYDGYCSIEFEGSEDCIEGIAKGFENLKGMLARI